MRTLFAVAMVSMACGLAAADDQVEIKNLIGKWELSEAKPGQSMTLEFTKEMKMTVIVGEAGKETKIDGMFQVDANKLHVQLKFMNEELKETLTVKKLTLDELVTEDSKGKSETLRKKK